MRRVLLLIAPAVVLLCVNWGCNSLPVKARARAGVPVRPDWSAKPGQPGEFPASVRGWVNDFQGGKVKALVDEAWKKNYDLSAAAARMRAAEGRRLVEGSERFPRVSGDFDSGRRRRSSTGAGDSTGVSGQRVNNFDLGMTFGWELDVWGRLRNRSRAADADALAAIMDYRAARLSLAANTAKAWFNAAEAEQQVRLAEETVKSFQANLDVLEGNFVRGVDARGGDAALDLRLATANVEGARARLKSRQRERDAAARALEVLLGRYPANEIKVRAELPEIRRSVPAGLPSELLRRRPDILAAERRLAAALERVMEAKKSLLPSIDLTGGAGRSSVQLDDILRPDSIVWNIANSITQPVFEGGRLIGEIKISGADRDERIALYGQTVLNAFQEVETTLAAEAYLGDEQKALEKAASESIAAEELAWDQYQRGLVDIVTVLESQRRAFDSRSSSISIKNQRLQNRIDLYLALGGDFDSEDAPELAVMREGVPGKPAKTGRKRR